jgi:hypothetical protein
MAEEYRDVTFGYWGVELKEWQAIQRLVLAGFGEVRLLTNMFAIIEGESGSYTKAWHANVLRDPLHTGPIVRNETGQMLVQSVDLGFIQRNVDVAGSGTWVDMTEEAMASMVNALFDENPALADAQLSAEIAFDLFSQRGFQPWFAYKPGTVGFYAKKRRAAKAIANYILRTQVGRFAEVESDGGKIPTVEFVNVTG